MMEWRMGREIRRFYSSASTTTMKLSFRVMQSEPRFELLNANFHRIRR